MLFIVGLSISRDVFQTYLEKLQFAFVTRMGFVVGQIVEVAEACKQELGLVRHQVVYGLSRLSLHPTPPNECWPYSPPPGQLKNQPHLRPLHPQAPTPATPTP